MPGPSFDVGAGAEGLVGVDGDDAEAPAGRVDELFDRAGVRCWPRRRWRGRCRAVAGSVLEKKTLGVLSADDDGVDAAAKARHGIGAVFGVVGARRIGYEEARLLGRERENVDAVGRGVDQLFAVRCVVVDVEVEGGGAGLIGQAIDAVAGVLVDPCGGWSLRMGQRKNDGESEGR